MSSVDWLMIEPSMDEEFLLERDARRILQDENHTEVAELCAALLKQNWYQTQVIKKSIGKIGELESKIICMENKVIQKKAKSFWNLAFFNN